MGPNLEEPKQTRWQAAQDSVPAPLHVVDYRGADLTAVEAARESALQSQALLELASRLGRVGAWALDLASMEGSWSRELLNLYEFEPGQHVTPDLLVSLADPDRRAALGQAMQACHMNGTPVDVEFPSLTAKRRRVWLRLTAEAVRDRCGTITRLQGAVQDITDRKHDAERLRALNQRLTTTLESITEAFVTVDGELRFTYVNGEAERQLMAPRSDLLGYSAVERFPALFEGEFRGQIERALVEGSSRQVEAYSPTLRRWLHLSVFPSDQGLALCIRDVTESKLAQRKLVMSEERFRLLFETSADGIVKVTPSGKIRHCNRAACAMFGRTEPQMRELCSVQLVFPGEHRLRPMIQERLRTGGARGELTLLRADGSTFEAEVNTSTFTNAQGETFVTLVIRDATDRVRLRQKLIALNEELADQVSQRTRELECANGELKGFARSLAHDLRQPIAAAKSFAYALEMALAKNQEQAARDHAQQILKTAQWMGDYVDALLSLTRISQVALSMENVDLSGLAADLLEELRGQEPGRVAVLHVQPGLRARGDRTLLRLLLQNLLGNAWKFTGRQACTRISFTAAATTQGDRVYSVGDNGAGLDMSRAQRLFETFQRFHKSSDYPGTGIGLANAQKIVARHGGRIWAESQPGKGARFLFTLGGPATKP